MTSTTRLTYSLTGYILHSSMQFLLYCMLCCNLLMGCISYMNHDQPGVSHAATFGLVAVVGLVAAWGNRRMGQ